MVKKRLHRSRNHRVIAGVCGGIAEYGNWDPSIVRLLWVLGTVLTGIFTGVLAYVIVWIVVPEQ